jgi:predicted RNA binding protein YcfA (HicA-like mRNA interferase family)
VEKVLKRAGFNLIRQKGTSHATWEGVIKGTRRVVTVDHLGGKKKEQYGRGLMASMIRQSGLTKQEFYSYL